MDVPNDKTDLLGRIDTASLYQPLLERFNAVLNACAARGAIYVATCGVRTYAEQQKLYDIGRKTGTPGHYVTKAPGGYSPHNFGVAVDFCKHNDDAYTGKLNPDYRDKQYLVLADESQKHGLEAGYFWDFQDSPHIQLPLRKHGITWGMMRTWYAKGGYAEVFRQLDQRGPW